MRVSPVTGRAPPRARDDELVEIRRLYAQLAVLSRNGSTGHQSEAYQKMIVRIRALVDERTAIRGDEMVITFEKASGFGQEDR